MNEYLKEAKQLIQASVAATGFAETDMYQKAHTLAVIAQAEAMERIAVALERLAGCAGEEGWLRVDVADKSF